MPFCEHGEFWSSPPSQFPVHMLLALPIIASCLTSDDTATFQTYSFSGHVVWNLTCPFAKRAFLFIGSSAQNVKIYDGTWNRTLEKPYAVGSTMNVTVEFDAGDKTDIVRVLTAVSDCANGAYYTSGGQEITLDIKANGTEYVDTRYCVFSPSADNKPVTVRYGLTEYTRIWEKATIYYQDGNGTATKACDSNETCSIRLPNAHYYVSYYKGNKPYPGGIVYGRTNDDNDGFTECAASPIGYAPAMQARIPYDAAHAANTCKSKSKSNKAVVIVFAVLGSAAVVTVVILGVFGFFASCGIAGCVRRATKQETTTLYDAIADQDGLNASTSYMEGRGNAKRAET